VGGDDGRTINDRKSGHLRHLLVPLLDPHGGQAEGRVGGLGADELLRRAAGVDGQQHAGEGLAFADHRAAQRHAVDAGLQVEVVADVHRRRQETHVLRKLLAHALDAAEQIAAALRIHERDQAVADFQAQGVDGGEVVPARFGIGRAAPRVFGTGRRGLAVALAHAQASQPMPPAISRNTMLGMPGIRPSPPTMPAMSASARGELNS
jgi:hypothetical protein